MKKITITLTALAFILCAFVLYQSCCHLRARRQLYYIEEKLSEYHADTHMFPTFSQGLTALYSYPVLSPLPSGWNGPYLEEKKGFVPDMDPWHNFIIYGIIKNKDHTETVVLKSLGMDRKEGGILFARDIVLSVSVKEE